jgi:hypothetical protein
LLLNVRSTAFLSKPQFSLEGKRRHGSKFITTTTTTAAIKIMNVTGVFVHVLVLLAAGFALCFG